jgi:orotidine-5'-phosphate decarboxylase
VALDTLDTDIAAGWASAVAGHAAAVKVGLQLYLRAGAAGVEQIRAAAPEAALFLDLKLHDIPNTVAGAVRSAAALGVDLLTIHASGGRAMLSAASEAASASSISPLLLAVTVLTSLDDAALGEAWGLPDASAGREAVRLARLAQASGIGGMVCSVGEVAAIRDATRPGLVILTPGIRLSGDAEGDQSRVATPAEAAGLNVDYVVIGRTVTAATDPRAAFGRVLEELGSR